MNHPKVITIFPKKITNHPKVITNVPIMIMNHSIMLINSLEILPIPPLWLPILSPKLTNPLDT